jgi:adenylate kinase family enzyme
MHPVHTLSLKGEYLMTRVAIIGNAGGGKSTLCAQLGESLNLPVYPVDKLQWKPGWIATPVDEFRQKHEELLALDRWIIDGWGSWQDIEARFQAADTIIIVNHPLIIHYWWALKRQFKCLFRPRPDGPEGCPMLPMTGKLMRMIWDIHHTGRPQLLLLVETFRNTKRIIHITSPHQLRDFLQTC